MSGALAGVSPRLPRLEVRLPAVDGGFGAAAQRVTYISLARRRIPIEIPVIAGNRGHTSLPSIPQVAVRLLEIYSESDFSVDQIVEIIETDPAITARVLKFANSAFFGGGWIDSLQRSVLWLGQHTLTCMVLGFSLALNAQKPGKYARLYREYWLQSVIQAIAMQLLMQRTHPALGDAAFSAGLLLDIGRLALLDQEPEQCVAINEAARLQQCPLRVIESATLEATHASLGAEMLESWGFPDQLVTLARCHDLDLDEVLSSLEEDGGEELAVANVASALGDFMVGLNPVRSLEKVQVLCNRELGLTNSEIDAYWDAVRSRLSETSEMLATDLSQLPPPGELLAAAREQLVAISLQSGGNGQASAKCESQPPSTLDSAQMRVQELERRTCIDNLTGVYSRDYFQQRLLQRLQSGVGPKLPNIVLLLELDDVRRITESCGQDAGDAVLRTVASVLRDNLRQRDVVARYDREQFALLLQCADELGVHKVVQRLRTKVSQAAVPFGREELRVTLRIGGAIHDTQVVDEKDGCARMLALADQALYEAKRAGGNAVVLRRLAEEGVMHQSLS
jgi:diguanylate cyclase (GGDEF)-like protein